MKQAKLFFVLLIHGSFVLASQANQVVRIIEILDPIVRRDKVKKVGQAQALIDVVKSLSMMQKSILWPALLLQEPAVGDDGYQVLESMTQLSDGTLVSDLKVLSQNCELPQCQGKHCRLYGCGFMALKNILLMRLALQNIDHLSDGLYWLQDPQVYADFFAPDQGWFDEKQRVYPLDVNDSLRNKLIMQPEQLKHLLHEIFQGRLVAPVGSRAIADEIVVAYDLDGAQRHENKKNITVDSAVALYKAGRKFQEQAEVMIPCILGYSHQWGRHWIAALVCKHAGKIEVLLADSWKMRDAYNIPAIEILLDWFHDPEGMWENYKRTVFSTQNMEWQETLKAYRTRGALMKAGEAFRRDERRDFEPLPDDVVVEFDQPVAFELSRVRNLVGEQKIISGIPVYKLNVLSQGNASGGAWTCGFHSLKNVLYLLQALQTNPMTQAVGQRLQKELQDRLIFEGLFLNGKALTNPGDHSWLLCATMLPTFRRNDGIYPADQRVLLQQIDDGTCLTPENIQDDLLHYVFPINGLSQTYFATDDRAIVPKVMYRCMTNQWPAVAFTSPIIGQQHFIGIVFHRVNTPAGLEVFVVDSLNRPLQQSQQIVEQLILFYKKMELAVVDQMVSQAEFLVVG